VVLGRAADLFDLVTADGERPAGDGGNTGTLALAAPKLPRYAGA
jgi:hypothetical protein